MAIHPTESRPSSVSCSPEIFRFPATPVQQRLWFLGQLHAGSPLYNIPFAVRMEGPLDAGALRAALNRVVARHEILRTCFARHDDIPVQIVAPALEVPLPVDDLTTLPREARAAEADRLTRAEAREPFDLARLPLLRTRLIRLSDREHILVLTVHHIVFDGWSLGVFFRALAESYDGAGAETEPGIQYADFAVWQDDQDGSADKSVTWWQGRLSGHREPLELPADRTRPAHPTHQGAMATLALAGELRASLEALGRREGTTLFMTLLAAWQALLHRYTGQTDILVGTPVAGRKMPETETLIGPFINTLVLHGDLSGDPGFTAFLARVRETVLESLAHDNVPFEKVVEAVQPVRDNSRPALFQVMFALERPPLEGLVWPGLTLTTLPLDSGTAKFDLTLYVVDDGDGLILRAEYATDLFAEATIQRLLAHYEVLLQGIAADPSTRLSVLPLLTAYERHQLSAGWNNSAADYPRRQTVAGLFAAQAAGRPEATAVIDDEGAVSYRDLDERSNRLAHFLRQGGVTSGTLVGICVDRTVAMLVGLLGILKAGGAYVPLDPGFPADRLAWMMADSQAPVLLTQKALLGVLPPSPAKHICLDEEWPEISRQSSAAPQVETRPDDLAYVIYTSGSTGRPKGVAIPHGAVVNFLRSMQRQPGLTAADRLLAVTTLSFDIAALELFLPLTVGAVVVLASRAEAADAARLAERIAASNATVMQATPATWRMLLDAGWAGGKSLRIFCGGEALPRALADRLLPRCAELWNLYGPTETTIWSSAGRVEADGQPITIGRPIANTQLHVLDAHRQPVPVGVPGELYIGGDGLARGYVNRPDVTAEKFLADPFSAVPGARVYRTGDLVRRRGDGGIEVLGRVDHQIKLRGFRIEPGEIEAVLREMPAVREAVVVAREDTPGDRRLVAYLTGHDGPAPDDAGLREFLRQKLPDYMVPSAFVRLEQLPLTPNGKIDRRALPAPVRDQARMAAGFVAPRAGVEQAIAAVWTEVLAVNRPGVDDNFFDLGGHSLNVVQVQGRLRERLVRELPLLTFFQHPTIRALARALGQGGNGNDDPGEFRDRVRARAARQRQRTAATRDPAGARG